jgi:hypothetical protein
VLFEDDIMSSFFPAGRRRAGQELGGHETLATVSGAVETINRTTELT